jgi:serine/threonine protein kinase
MPLSSGQTLAQYEILTPIGAGGMGEVYRARDTRLGRDVAIKVLPDDLRRDPERLERFRREARLLAQLNHPHVATVHGLEEVNGKALLVMELVEGETLAERIARGPIPIEPGIQIFLQLAEGLEAAHERGIVHRDLKPANVMIRPDGEVKILDFGLAKTLTAEALSGETSQSSTLTRGTALGTILGTASYMSPEQARGKDVDKRTDIWAFGCCLYEALTGRKAFAGETASDIIGGVLRDDPDWRLVAPRIAPLVRRCLRKDPRARLRDIGDARLELLEPSVTPPRPNRGRPSVVPWILFGLSAAAAAWFAFREPARPSRVTRFVTVLPEGARLGTDVAQQHVAFSPDGSRIAYTVVDADSGGRSRLYLLERSSFQPTPVPRTEGARNPFFSPDGKWIGFFDGTKLKKVALDGGASITICAANVSPGASWGIDDRIVYADKFSSGFRSVSASGGEPETLTTLAPGETSHRWPQHLPDGKSLLFTVRTARGARIVVQSLRTGERKTLLSEAEGATQALYLASGRLLYD